MNGTIIKLGWKLRNYAPGIFTNSAKSGITEDIGGMQIK